MSFYSIHLVTNEQNTCPLRAYSQISGHSASYRCSECARSTQPYEGWGQGEVRAGWIRLSHSREIAVAVQDALGWQMPKAGGLLDCCYSSDHVCSPMNFGVSFVLTAFVFDDTLPFSNYCFFIIRNQFHTSSLGVGSTFFVVRPCVA